ncbi:MAG: OmpA family protein [Candidimonas sp.]|jgi:OOP family OmpA-OmpF porin
MTVFSISKTAMATVAAAFLLAGCGSLSKVSQEGTTDEPVFPDPDSTTFNTGAFPNLDDLRLVAPGVTKDQLYNLLGRPHFAEGLVGVREWDYLFHFRTPQGIQTCQFKILFDKDKLAQSFFWKPEGCAAFLNSGQPVSKAENYTLGSDLTFAFGSATLTAAGQARIAEIAAQLRQYQTIDAVQVAGHTDRIGGDAANAQVSQRRAEAVRQALIDGGVPAGVIQAAGHGERQPVKECAEQGRSALIACLAPNRRVEISAYGKK